MKRVLLALLLIASTAKADPDTYLQVEQGRKLATAGDCVACHTAPNGTPFAGGRGISTPFGVINSANLTPDLETGLAGWSEAEFHRAMTQGIRRDGRIFTRPSPTRSTLRSLGTIPTPSLLFFAPCPPRPTG